MSKEENLDRGYVYAEPMLLLLKVLGQCCQIVGVMIHVTAATSLSGATVAASIVGDDAKPFIEEEKHLRVPIVPA